MLQDAYIRLHNAMAERNGALSVCAKTKESLHTQAFCPGIFYVEPVPAIGGGIKCVHQLFIKRNKRLFTIKITWNNDKN